MRPKQILTQQSISEEADAFRTLNPGEYDRKVCAIIESIMASPRKSERTQALMATISRTLRRHPGALTESPKCCVNKLLSLAAEHDDPVLHSRIRLLLVLAWLQLSRVVKEGPESISTTPELPPGAGLPGGADPSLIADPALRKQAQTLAEFHRQAVERWNARQRALDHLHHIAALLELDIGTFKDDTDSMAEMKAAMSLAPAIPPDLEQLLRDTVD